MSEGGHEDRELVEHDHRHGHQQEADHVGRRSHDRGDDRQHEDRVGSLLAQPRGGDNPDLRQQHDDDRHLEDHAAPEGERRRK